jgi:hypothetical protein
MGQRDFVLWQLVLLDWAEHCRTRPDASGRLIPTSSHRPTLDNWPALDDLDPLVPAVLECRAHITRFHILPDLSRDSSSLPQIGHRAAASMPISTPDQDRIPP